MSSSVNATQPAGWRLVSVAAAISVSMGMLTLSSAALASANLLSNGSFESPVLTPGTNYAIETVGAVTLPAWSIVGPVGKNVALIEATYSLPDAAGINFAAADGVQWIDLTGGGSNAYEGVKQTVVLSPGSYDVSFFVGNVVQPGGPLGVTSAVDLWINGVNIQTFTNPGAGGGGINWTRYSYSFNASGATSIALMNADGPGDHLNGLDHVTLQAVPEPTSALLLLAGLLAVTAQMRGGRAISGKREK